MRFQHVILAYFIVGAVLWGGGVLDWNETGVGTFIIDDPTAHTADATTNSETQGILGNIGNAIVQAVSSFVGGLMIVWNILSKLIGYFFWPITVMQSVNAPPRMVVVVGGTMSMMFLAAFIRVLRASA